ncbi:acyltransferase [Vibrio fluvialis]|uniref:acyltransferase n=1 Tax=Vibrio fluvialis TaxID=676 RepID=UPI00193178BE|nr:acyltransferase [Vibrio fluvialis]EKO3957607.1 acyltransferase [Vibrio fluvialis]MBY7904414.1 acyltransferase [Vibrio fluvialis]HDM8046981.1 acyltransferase [Vibrio fluvialis]
MNFLSTIKLRLQNSITLETGSKLRIDPNAKVRKCIIKATNVNQSSIEIERSASVRRCKIVVEGRNNKLIIEKGCQLQNLLIEVLGEDCTLIIGKDTRNTGEGKISCQEKGTTLRIGANSLLAKGVTILTSDGHDILEHGQRINPAKDILLEEHVWLGQDVMVLKGAKIGSGSVIGARSVVSDVIPSQSIAVGSPAKVIKQGITWDSALTFAKESE